MEMAVFIKYFIFFNKKIIVVNSETEYLAFVDRLSSTLTECEGLAIRALNRIPAENDLFMTPEVLK